MDPLTIGTGLTLIGGALGWAGAHETNVANAKQARLNREFQERMRATQYQTAVGDMQKAGLNPALAYQQGGAGTPGGSQAAPAVSKLGGAVTGAVAAQQAQADIQATRAQVERTKAETANINFDVEAKKAQIGWQNALLEQESIRSAALAQLMQDPKWVAIMRQQMEADLKLTNTNARDATARAAATELGLPALQNAANAANTLWGRAVVPYIQSAKDLAQIGATLMAPGALKNMIGGGKMPTIKLPHNVPEVKRLIGFNRKPQ